MNKKEYTKIGEVKWINNLPYFLFGYSNEGFVFKDEEAYEKDWDAPCYTPEYAAEDNAITIDDVEYECGGSKQDCNWYSHRDLLQLCAGNREWCDALFSQLEWAYPETYIHDESDVDTAYYYRFIKPGAKVWWNDPAGETSGIYEVYKTPIFFDENGELTEESLKVLDECLLLDMIIGIASKHSEAEVYIHELTPIYSDLKEQNV